MATDLTCCRCCWGSGGCRSSWCCRCRSSRWFGIGNGFKWLALRSTTGIIFISFKLNFLTFCNKIELAEKINKLIVYNYLKIVYNLNTFPKLTSTAGHPYCKLHLTCHSGYASYSTRFPSRSVASPGSLNFFIEIM